MPPFSDSLTVADRLSCQAVAGLSLLPLLLFLPLAVGAPLGALALAHVLYMGQRQPGKWLHGALDAFLIGFSLVAASATPLADIRVAAMVALLAVTASHMTATVRQGLITLNLAFIGVFTTLNLPDSGARMAWSGGVVLIMIAQNQRLMARESGDNWNVRQALQFLTGALIWSVPLALVFFGLAQSTLHSLSGLRMTPRVAQGAEIRMSPGTFGARLSNPATAFRIFFEGPRPPASERYWRSSVLWDFNGQSWTRPGWAETEATPAESEAVSLEALSRWRYRIEPVGSSINVSLDQASIEPQDQEARWTRDHVLLLPPGNSVPETQWWDATRRPFSDATPLTEQERAAALLLPAGLNPRTQKLAQQWRWETPDDQAYVARTLLWFGQNLHYSLEAPESKGVHQVDSFLFSKRVGYCQHLSSSFAVFMRAAGIPSRVVVGYAGGTPHAWADYWRVREMEAHAWVEVWLEGRGWIRVDPTSVVEGLPGVPTWWRRWLASDTMDWADERVERLVSWLKQAGQGSWLGRLAWDRWIGVLLPLGLAVSGWVGWRLWGKRQRRTQAARDWQALETRLAHLSPEGERLHHEGTGSYVQRMGRFLTADSRVELNALAEGWQNLRYSTSGTGVIGWTWRVRRYRPQATHLTP